MWRLHYFVEVFPDRTARGQIDCLHFVFALNHAGRHRNRVKNEFEFVWEFQYAGTNEGKF